MPQVTLAREMLRRMENRIMKLAELDLEIAFVSYLERVLHCLGRLDKTRFHLLRRAQIKLFLRIFHSLRVRQKRLCPDADQAVMGVRMALLQVMNVVARDQFKAELFGPGNQLAVHLRLLRDSVVL